MIAFLLRRLAWFAATLFAVVALSFAIMRNVRGGPFDADRELAPAIEQNLRARYHLDWPLWKQFLQYVGPFHLDAEGFAWTSPVDPARRWQMVRGSDGRSRPEAEPRLLPHPPRTNAAEQAALDAAVAEVLAAERQSATELPEILGTLGPGGAPAVGTDPRLPPLLSALARACAGPTRDAARVERASALLARITAHAPDPDPAPPGMSRELALARHWFGWYFQQGGDRIWHTGARPYGGLLAGDLGPSFRYRDFTVNDILAQSPPISAALGTAALLFALAIGIPAGILAALQRGRRADVVLRLCATIGIALPNFVIASLAVLLFAFAFPLFPVGGWGSARHMVLPAIALGLPYAAWLARLARTGMLESLSEPHILTARAKGLARSRVVLVHALPQALLPIVSYLGPAIAGILTGSLVIERIFFLPGTGSHFVNSALNRDYTLAMGVTILYTALVYTLNTLVDLAYTLIDPRIDLVRR